ncbi:dynein axonemal light chain 4-like [Rhodnius prolixus]|uniref:dynein axonemal light chain 4-like n=1 Tax=Rhodnius prolixus TaxID=13249 RepID=UPI003D18EF42
MAIDRSIAFNHPITKTSDMNDDTQTEITEMLLNTYEKNKHQLDKAASIMKSTLEEKYGPIWHVIIGQSYGFDVHHFPKTMLHIYLDGIFGITVWKC